MREPQHEGPEHSILDQADNSERYIAADITSLRTNVETFKRLAQEWVDRKDEHINQRTANGMSQEEAAKSWETSHRKNQKILRDKLEELEHMEAALHAQSAQSAIKQQHEPAEGKNWRNE